MKAQSRLIAGVLIIFAIAVVASIGLNYTGQVIETPETPEQPETPSQPDIPEVPETPSEPETPQHSYTGIKTIINNPEDFAGTELWISGSLKRPSGENSYYLEDGEDNRIMLQGIDFSGKELNQIYEVRSMVVSDRLCDCTQKTPLLQWVDGDYMPREECEAIEGVCKVGSFSSGPDQEVICQCRVISLLKYFDKDLGLISAEACQDMESSSCEPTSIKYSVPFAVVYNMNQL